MLLYYLCHEKLKQDKRIKILGTTSVFFLFSVIVIFEKLIKYLVWKHKYQ
jgi:hypothetical protein